MKFSKLRAEKDKILDMVSNEIEAFLHGHKVHKLKKRHCAWCSKMFWPRNRYHFLCSDICRRWWNRGWFKPRSS